MSENAISNGTPQAQDFWVPPLHPVKAGDIALPGPDQIGISVIQPLISCFKTSDDFDEQRFIGALQTATAGAVWETPALAGRVEWEDETRHRIKCTISEEPKVQVRVKYLLHLDANQLEAQHWPPHCFPHHEVCLNPTPPSGVGTYNFGVQANIIRGGVLLVLHMNHTILDGSAQCTLMTVFAHHLARAMDGKEPSPSRMMPPEALDKAKACGSHPAKPILEWKDLKPAQKSSPEEARAALIQRMTNCTITAWYISSENQKKLRAAIEDPRLPKLTLAVCLSTWLWRAVTRARGLESDVATRLLMPVQTRGRLEDLHASYTGSALVYARAKATVSELNSVSSLELAQRIGKSVAWWTPERIREFWGSIEECDDIANYAPNADREFGTDLEITNMTNFPYYGIHWGRGLQLEDWRVPALAFTDGWTGFLPRRRDGGLEFFAFLARNTVVRLMKDPEFRMFTEYWTSTDPELDKQAAESVSPKVQT